MKRDPLLYGIVGVLIGGAFVWLLAVQSVNNNMTGMMRMMGMQRAQEMMQDSVREDRMHRETSMTMDEMSESLKGKVGDEFDKAFIEQMIDHHQGAIDMANLAQISAKHDEIKSLADDIVSAQTTEINMMREWQKSWGY